MADLYPQDWVQYLSVLAVFLRLLGLFVMMPAFSHQAIPGQVKVAIALALALVTYPMVKTHLAIDPNSILSLVSAAMKETLIGLLMGFVASLTYEAIALAAHFIGMQVGLGTVALIDPQHDAGTSVLVPLHGWITLMLFFLLDLHLNVVGAFISSFGLTSHVNVQSLGGIELFKFITTAFYRLLVLAIQMAAPLTLLSLLVNVAMGILGRLMPQINIFFLAFPVTITLSIGALYLLAPSLFDLIDDRLHAMVEDVFEALRVI